MCPFSTAHDGIFNILEIVTMYLNTLRPAAGAKHSKKRLGRGIGSGTGKTCGRGHKGQHARAGGYHKVGFEGGQMPLHRRLPKFGFTSQKALKVAEVRLHELANLEGKLDLEALKKANIVPIHALSAKVILSGKISNAIQLTGIRVTAGAKQAIEAAGGSVEV